MAGRASPFRYWLVPAALAAGCASALPSAPSAEPVTADPAAKVPQYQTNLELGRKRELLKMDLRFLRGRIDAAAEEIALLERDLKIRPGSPVPGPPKPIPVQPPLPTLPAHAPAGDPPDPEPAGSEAAAGKAETTDPTELRLRREIAALTARRDSDLARWHELLRRRGELRDELHRRSASPAPAGANPVPGR